MDVNTYLQKFYPWPGCWNLVGDVYVNELGISIKNYVPKEQTHKEMALTFRRAIHNGDTSGFVKVDTPKNFTVVLMGKKDIRGVHHAGIWYDNKVLHTLKNGTLYQDLHSLSDQYEKIEFWEQQSSSPV